MYNIYTRMYVYTKKKTTKKSKKKFFHFGDDALMKSTVHADAPSFPNGHQKLRRNGGAIQKELQKFFMSSKL